ncbi:hypothetical protein [Nesterenkonia flava]|uniref:Uncharacterized protein n=1 Tax=Nesterenkonia flava TaxID=469799 RepID=A0ABU1FUZ8_9MICC|nr:hypothetical protein [Nesterenkonia flava]MDR5712495.1 hypothetical protein [Nesterenkonia flava]
MSFFPHVTPRLGTIRASAALGIVLLSLSACAETGAQGASSLDAQRAAEATADASREAAPETSAPNDYTLEELRDMSFEQFRSAEVSREQRYQLLWHFAELSEEHAELFSHEEGLFAYNPTNLAHRGNSPDNILLQHWYLQQLYRLGELLAEEHGGQDIALKLALAVDPAGVAPLENLVAEADTETPAWLLESRYELVDAAPCLAPPEGTQLRVPWEEQTCYQIDFAITQGEANEARPYFHWVEFEDADGDDAGLWVRSAQHWR